MGNEVINKAPFSRILAIVAFGVLPVYAGTYTWNGGGGRWGDSSKWTPAGVPGADDIAKIDVNLTQTVIVDADATPFQIDVETKTDGAKQTFSISSGKTLCADDMRIVPTKTTDVTIEGGGELSLTNQALWVSGMEKPVTFTVSGAGTVFNMPKDKSSGLYIGANDTNYRDSADVFRVTDHATVIISNATCVGNMLDGAIGSRGNLIVDDGAYFYGGQILFIGRNYTKPGIVCAVTNATLAAERITTGPGYYTVFVGSNATVRGAWTVEFPNVDAGSYARNHRMHFEDSTFEAWRFHALASGNYNTGTLVRCSITCEEFSGCFGGAWNSRFEVADSTINCTNAFVGRGGSSNSVLRLSQTSLRCSSMDVGRENSLDSTLQVEDGAVTVGMLFAGALQTAVGSRYEQNGGTFTASTAIVIGKYDSRNCGVSFRGLSGFSSKEIICGDAISVGYESLRSKGVYANFADMVVDTTKLYVGVASIGAQAYFTNATVMATLVDADATFVGRDAGATQNELVLEDSTFNQNGGNVFVGRYGGATNNTLRLVRSTYNFTTKNNKGDVIVGYDVNANGNRVELTDHSTFNYDRAWMAIGHNGASNVWSMCDGSSLNAPNGRFWLAGVGSSAVGNRLFLGGASSMDVWLFGMRYSAVAEFAGVGNSMTIGTGEISIASGCSFLFHLGAETSTSPILTINKALPYSASIPLTVDVSEAGLGVYTLISCDTALPDPVVGTNVLLANVPPIYSANAWLSADKKTLFCNVSLLGTVVIIR